MADEEFEVRPGRARDSGAHSWRKAGTLVGRVNALARKGGPASVERPGSPRGTGHLGRGRSAGLRKPGRLQRRVMIKARVVRHRGTAARGAPLARHIRYLGRDGATRDDAPGRMFDAAGEDAGTDAFARRCEDDRHHFRFIVSPEDAREMADLRAFTRELMDDMASDLGTRLDWIAVDHWNTDNPHIHVLVRGVAADGRDLVIDRGYIGSGLRCRAQERVTAELGPRSEHEIRKALEREVEAERWTSLDRQLQSRCDALGSIDLRPAARDDHRTDRLPLISRAQVLERMGLATRTGAASWDLRSDLETTLRAMGERGDIIRTMHRALNGHGAAATPPLALHENVQPGIVGRLVERGLQDELTGEAYAIIEGVDGRAHHVRFADLDRTGDALPGAIVATGSWTDRRGRVQASLQVRSDLPIEQQVPARGATWLDRQLLAPAPDIAASGFGKEVRDALERRKAVLVREGLARHEGGKVLFSSSLLARLRERDLDEAGRALSDRYGGLVQRPVAEGDFVTGIYRERVTLPSGRFAMIDDGQGFRLVPWRQDLERHLGQSVTGTVNSHGGIDWSLGRARGVGR